MKLLTLIQTKLNMIMVNLAANAGNASNELTLNPSFNAKSVLDILVNAIMVLAILGGLIPGVIMIVGNIGEDNNPAKLRQGIITVFASLILGASIVTIVNMVIL